MIDHCITTLNSKNCKIELFQSVKLLNWKEWFSCIWVNSKNWVTESPFSAAASLRPTRQRYNWRLSAGQFTNISVVVTRTLIRDLKPVNKLCKFEDKCRVQPRVSRRAGLGWAPANIVISSPESDGRCTHASDVRQHNILGEGIYYQLSPYPYPPTAYYPLHKHSWMFC